MAPKRPPPLPRSLFTDQGPLAPGSAPLPPSPSTVHPEWVIDAHCFPGAEAYPPIHEPGLKGGQSGEDTVLVKGVVQVQMDATRPKFIENIDNLSSISTYPTIINTAFPHPPSIASEANGAIDILLPLARPLSEADWDLLEEAVNALDENWGKPAQANEASSGQGMDVDSPRPTERKIVVSGILPPPLSKSSSPLLNSDEYNLYQARLAQLSLHANVYLKALPPVLDARSAAQPTWWEDEVEVNRVVRMYLAPAIETFGTHRIIFGAAPAVLESLDTPASVPVKGNQWYTALRKVVAELGEDKDAMQAIMGKNAVGVYSLP